MRYSIHIFFVLSLLIFNSPTFAQSINPFMPDDDIQTIRNKINQNGYLFKVRDYSEKGELSPFTPGRHPSANMVQFPAKTIKVRNVPILDNLPEKFDWRNVDGKSYIGPIRDQSNTGTCYSFAACAAAEGAFNIAANLYNEDCIDFSEAYLAWTLGGESSYSSHFDGSNGADYDYFELSALTKLGSNTSKEGVCLEQDFPFPNSSTPTEDEIKRSIRFPRFHFDNWSRIYPTDYEDTTAMIKSAMMTYGVIDTAVYVGPAFEQYKEGVYEDTKTEPEVTPYYYQNSNHAISLVGWDDNPPEGGGGCWILRNSWGSEWGEDGYMRIRYKSAGINMFACYMAFNQNTIYPFTSSIVQTNESNVTVSGFVKMGTPDIKCYFEYGNKKNLSFTTSYVDLKSENSPTIVYVTDTLKGLLPNQSYTYRLVVQNASDVIQGATDRFSTKKPLATIKEPEKYAQYLLTSFLIDVKTRDTPTNVYLEYGPTEDYGQISPIISHLRNFQDQIYVQDLMPNTTYHYRIISSNIGGIFMSEDYTFDSSKNIFLEDKNNKKTKIDWDNTWFLDGEDYYPSSYKISLSQGNIAKVPPTQAYSGKKNILITYDPFYKFEEDYTEEQGIKISKISPPICLSQFETAFLRFYHAQPADGIDQDELRVYYRNEPDNEWQLLTGAEYLNHVPEWIERFIELPELSPEYQIKFEVTGNFGHGVLLDRIEILQSPDTSINNWSIY